MKKTSPRHRAHQPASPAPRLRADLPMKAARPMAEPIVMANWTGCYIGAGGGYGMFVQRHRTIDPLGVPVTAGETDTGGKGWFGTVQVGCDYQFAQRWVIGAFADYDFGSIKGNFQPTGLIGAGGLGLFGEEKLKSSWAAGGRVGYLVLPQPAGLRLRRLHRGALRSAWPLSNLFNNVPTIVSLAPQTYKGWFIGTGYEYGIDFLSGSVLEDRISLRELRFRETGAHRRDVRWRRTRAALLRATPARTSRPSAASWSIASTSAAAATDPNFPQSDRKAPASPGPFAFKGQALEVLKSQFTSCSFNCHLGRLNRVQGRRPPVTGQFGANRGRFRGACDVPELQDAADVSPGRQRGFRAFLFSLRRQRRLHRRPLRALRGRSEFGRCRVA